MYRHFLPQAPKILNRSNVECYKKELQTIANQKSLWVLRMDDLHSTAPQQHYSAIIIHIGVNIGIQATSSCTHVHARWLNDHLAYNNFISSNSQLRFC